MTGSAYLSSEGQNGGERDLPAGEAISQNKQMKSCDKYRKETGNCLDGGARAVEHVRPYLWTILREG